MNSKNRLIIILLILVLIIGCAYVLYQQMGSKLDTQQLSINETASEATAEGEKEEVPKAPDFVALDAQGNQVNFYDYLGKPIVLNFWASWCGPCQMEMPDFDEAYKTYGTEINFLMVNMTDGSRETLEIASEFISQQSYSFPVFYDAEQQAAYAYGVSSLPTTYFIDADGYGVAGARGAIDAETLKKGIEMLLSEGNG